MSVFKRPGAETYSFNFQVRGRRVSGNTQARHRKDAGAAERQLKAKAKADTELKRKRELSLTPPPEAPVMHYKPTYDTP